MNQSERLLEKTSNIKEEACWEIRRCPPEIRAKCPALVSNSAAALFMPCWEVSGTYNKMPCGTDQSVCSVCHVYKRYELTVSLDGVKW